MTMIQMTMFSMKRFTLNNTSRPQCEFGTSDYLVEKPSHRKKSHSNWAIITDDFQGDYH